MTSNYPDNLDQFRSWHDDLDYLTHDEQETLVDALTAIQDELGVAPGGAGGSIFGRLFGLGQIHQLNAGWNRLQWSLESAVGGTFDLAVSGMTFVWQGWRHDKGGTPWDQTEGQPGAFGSHQFPIAGTAPNGCPWRHATAIHNDVAVTFVGKGRNNGSLSGGTQACTFGVITWSLIT